MNVQRIAAFSDGDVGGNPAGVVIADALRGASEMQRIAAEVAPHGAAIETVQGEDMGSRSRLTAEIPETPGSIDRRVRNDAPDRLTQCGGTASFSAFEWSGDRRTSRNNSAAEAPAAPLERTFGLTPH